MAQTTQTESGYATQEKVSDTELPSDLDRLAEMVRCGELVPTPNDSPGRRALIEAAVRHNSRWDR